MDWCRLVTRLSAGKNFILIFCTFCLFMGNPICAPQAAPWRCMLVKHTPSCYMPNIGGSWASLNCIDSLCVWLRMIDVAWELLQAWILMGLFRFYSPELVMNKYLNRGSFPLWPWCIWYGILKFSCKGGFLEIESFSSWYSDFLQSFYGKPLLYPSGSPL